jgi:hypothetical protein
MLLLILIEHVGVVPPDSGENAPLGLLDVFQSLLLVAHVRYWPSTVLLRLDEDA